MSWHLNISCHRMRLSVLVYYHWGTKRSGNGQLFICIFVHSWLTSVAHLNLEQFLMSNDDSVKCLFFKLTIASSLSTIRHRPSFRRQSTEVRPVSTVYWNPRWVHVRYSCTVLTISSPKLGWAVEAMRYYPSVVPISQAAFKKENCSFLHSPVCGLLRPGLLPYLTYYDLMWFHGHNCWFTPSSCWQP